MPSSESRFFPLEKEERKKDFLQISWNRLNELLTVKSIGKQLKSNSPFYKPCSFILITLLHNKSGCTVKEPVITLTLEEYEELRKEHECLEKEHAELQRNTKPLCRSIPARSKKSRPVQPSLPI